MSSGVHVHDLPFGFQTTAKTEVLCRPDCDGLINAGGEHPYLRWVDSREVRGCAHRS